MSGVLTLSGHPLQRCGAWAIAVLADRASPASGQAEKAGKRPQEVTAGELDEVAERIAVDAAEAAVAQASSAAYDWWKVLFALYPNSPPTHARRQRDRSAIRAEVTRLLGEDRAEGVMRPCTFCGVPSSTLWAKSLLPMFDTTRALNTLPPGSAGWPVCRACRVSLWAMPYGAWVTAGSATVLTSSDPEVEREFTARNVIRASRIQQAGFTSLPAGASPEAITLAALREHAAPTIGSAAAPGEFAGARAFGKPVTGATLWMFKNDNQEPWLRVSSTRVGVTAFLQAVTADSEARKGWTSLRRVMERRDSSGVTTLDGESARARLLFDPSGEPADRLLSELDRRLRKHEEIPRRVLWQWCALSRLYLEVMREMDVSKLASVADLFVKWISQESARGRFNEFQRASGGGWELHRLYRMVSARLYLDDELPGNAADLSPDLVLPLFEQRGWRDRVALYTLVLTGLIRAGVQLGKASADTDEDEAEVGDLLDPKPELEEEEGA